MGNGDDKHRGYGAAGPVLRATPSSFRAREVATDSRKNAIPCNVATALQERRGGNLRRPPAPYGPRCRYGNRIRYGCSDSRNDPFGDHALLPPEDTARTRQ